jgi:hypothetical protein
MLSCKNGTYFQVASQVAWYLDEMVLEDPILESIRHFEEHDPQNLLEQNNVKYDGSGTRLEYTKQELIRDIQVLTRYDPVSNPGISCCSAATGCFRR